MPLRNLPGSSWPPDLLGLGSLLIAQAGEDTWGKLAAAAATLLALAMVGAWVQVRAWWDASAVRQLLVVRRELAECKADKADADAELRDEKSDRARARERNRLESEEKDVEIAELRDLVSSLRGELAAAYKTIADRDHTVTENSRRLSRADATLTVISGMVLELLGDARSRKP